METTVCDPFFVAVCESFRFQPSTVETERFQNIAFWEDSTFETIFEGAF